MDIKKKIKSFPDSPGVYIMKDKNAGIIYIGKAVSLKKRVMSYFACRGVLQYAPTCKTNALMQNIFDIDYIRTASEEEALLLEAALVKGHQPRYNILLKDDKRYPLLKLTLNEDFPRLLIARRGKADGAVYFGPYTNASLLRKALRVLRRIFPLRTCKNIRKSACLNYHIGQCIAPCVNKNDKALYMQIVDDLMLFLSGKKNELIDSLGKRMKKASQEKDFETAARIRDQIQALTAATKIDRQNRIEGFDISSISGKDAVGSMVSFYNGMPDKSNYRKYRIRTVTDVDDYRMIEEVLTRRYKRLIAENLPLPDLVVIDGGSGHVSTARKTLDTFGLSKIKVLGIAKKEERIFSESGEEKISDDFRKLIQRVRDEAHRFAQSYHHVLRRKKIIGR